MKKISKFQSFFNHVNDYFKSLETWDKENRQLYNACETGEIEKFELYFNFKNPLLDIATCLHNACTWGNLNLAQYILKRVETEDMNHPHIVKFKSSGFSGTFVVSARNNRFDVVQFMLSPNFPEEIDMYCNNEGAMRGIVEYKNQKILQYLLYDKNYQLSENMKDFLQDKFPTVLKDFQKRDLFSTLNNMSDDKKAIKVKKI